MGVQNFEVQYSCVNCKASIHNTGSAQYGMCQKCNTGQALMDFRITAKLILQSKCGVRVYVRAYTPMLNEICTNSSESDEITMISLLTAAPFDAVYNGYHILTSIRRN